MNIENDQNTAYAKSYGNCTTDSHCPPSPFRAINHGSHRPRTYIRYPVTRCYGNPNNYNKQCRINRLDYEGKYKCPDFCRDAPESSQLSKAGSCGSGNLWPRKKSNKCIAHSDCDGYTEGKVGTLACRNGKCTKQ